MATGLLEQFGSLTRQQRQEEQMTTTSTNNHAPLNENERPISEAKEFIDTLKADVEAEKEKFKQEVKRGVAACLFRDENTNLVGHFSNGMTCTISNDGAVVIRDGKGKVYNFSKNVLTITDVSGFKTICASETAQNNLLRTRTDGVHIFNVRGIGQFGFATKLNEDGIAKGKIILLNTGQVFETCETTKTYAFTDHQKLQMNIYNSLRPIDYVQPIAAELEIRPPRTFIEEFYTYADAKNRFNDLTRHMCTPVKLSFGVGRADIAPPPTTDHSSVNVFAR